MLPDASVEIYGVGSIEVPFTVAKGGLIEWSPSLKLNVMKLASTPYSRGDSVRLGGSLSASVRDTDTKSDPV
jgi:hypothetical protein